MFQIHQKNQVDNFFGTFFFWGSYQICAEHYFKKLFNKIKTELNPKDCNKSMSNSETSSNSIITSSESQTQSCTPQDGKMPPSGHCKGPIARALLRQNNVNEFNQGCKENEILYFQDDDKNKPKCGECIPGTYGTMEEAHPCSINEYCSDEGNCVKLQDHPLYGATCPDESGTIVSLWCGTGLRCINHECYPCESGTQDPETGRICEGNQWTSSFSARLFYNPTAVSILVFTGIFFLYAIVLLCTSCYSRYKKKKSQHEQLNDENDWSDENSEEFYEDDESESENLASREEYE